MNFKSALFYTSRMLFPRGSKKTVGSKSIIGAIVCIALSLIPLVVVLSVSDGMVEGMTERLINLSSSHIQLQFDFIGEEVIDRNLIDYTLEKVKKVRGVTDAYELITTTGLVSSTKGRTGATVRALEPSVFRTVESYSSLFKCIDGDINDFYSKTGRNALIGKGIADALKISAGDTIRLITTQRINDRIIPKMTSFKVSGIISCGYQELDALWVFIPISEGVEILKPDTSQAAIMVEAEDPFGKQGQLRMLQEKIDSVTDFYASSYRWDELNKSQYENFASTKMLLVFIMLLIVLIACVNISSCIVMLSMERRREIAIMKSFGTKSKTISLSFVFTGVAIGLAGIVIGIPVGILISLNVNNLIWGIEQLVNVFAKLGYLIANGNLNSFYTVHLMDEAYYLESIPVHIPFIQILFYIIATVVLSLFTSLIPAVKAGAEKTIDTFRKAGS